MTGAERNSIIEACAKKVEDPAVREDYAHLDQFCTMHEWMESLRSAIAAAVRSMKE